MAHPTLCEIDRHTRLKCADAECVAQTFWAGAAADQANPRHDALDDAPRCDAMPLPQATTSSLEIALTLSEPEGCIESRHQPRGKRYFPNVMLPPLQRDKRNFSASNELEVAGMQHVACHAFERDRTMGIVGDDRVAMAVVGRMVQDRRKVGERCPLKSNEILRRIEV